jgi:hypothetical protein
MFRLKQLQPTDHQGYYIRVGLGNAGAASHDPPRSTQSRADAGAGLPEWPPRDGVVMLIWETISTC